MSNAFVATAEISSVGTGGSFRPFERAVQFLERFGAARRCAAAITAGRRPAESDLSLLDLKDVDFPSLSGN